MPNIPGNMVCDVRHVLAYYKVAITDVCYWHHDLGFRNWTDELHRSKVNAGVTCIWIGTDTMCFANKNKKTCKKTTTTTKTI